jgi:hypothetical protein
LNYIPATMLCTYRRFCVSEKKIGGDLDLYFGGGSDPEAFCRQVFTGKMSRFLALFVRNRQ